jgi:dihydroorotase
LQPNLPIIDNQAQVNFVQKSSGSATTFPNWRFDKGSEGRDMAELFDMKNCGAIAFGDYNKVKTMLICFRTTICTRF